MEWLDKSVFAKLGVEVNDRELLEEEMISLREALIEFGRDVGNPGFELVSTSSRDVTLADVVTAVRQFHSAFGRLDEMLDKSRQENARLRRRVTRLEKPV